MPTLETLVIKLETQTSGMNRGLKMAVSAFAGLSVAAIAFGKSSLDAFEPLDKATKRLGDGLSRIGQAKGLDDIISWSQKFSVATGINEAGIVDVTGKLEEMGSAFFKAAGPQAAADLEKLTGGLENMSAATGKSMSMLMRSMGAAMLNVPASAITSLQKYGVLTQEQADKVKALTDAGKNQAATQLEINAVTDAYAGAAAATATPLEKLTNLWNQLELIVGKFIMEGLSKLMDWAPKVLDWFQQTWKAIEPLVMVIAGPFINALKSLWTALGPLIDALKKLWDTFGPIIKIVAAVGLGILLLQALILGFIFEVLAKIVMWAVKFIDAFASVVDWVKTHFAEPIAGAVDRIWDKLKTVAEWIKGVFVDAWQAIEGPIKAVFDHIVGWIKTLLGWIQNAIDLLSKLPGLVGIGGNDPGGGAWLTGGKAPTHAKGGIFTQPTMGIIGEAGPEAVIPLDRMGALGGITVIINGDVTGEEVVRKVRDGLLKLGKRNGTTGL